MKHQYTKEEIQAAIDEACKATASSAYRPSFALLRLIESDTTDDWPKEAPARLHLAEKLLELLPELAKDTPEVFEFQGKIWTRHKPGDPMPCDGARLVECLYGEYFVGTPREGHTWKWSKGTSVIAWRYEDEIPEPPAAPWTPVVGDVVTLKSGGPKMTIIEVVGSVSHCKHFIGASLLTASVPSLTLIPASTRHIQ